MSDRVDNPYEASDHTSLSDNLQPRPFALSLFTVIFLAILLLSIAVSRYKLTTIFNDFDLALPAISEIALHFAMVLVTAMTLAAAIATAIAIRHRRAAVVCQLTLAGFGAVLLTIYVIGTVGPLIRLINALS